MGEIIRTSPDDKTSSRMPRLRRWTGNDMGLGSQEYLDHLKEQNVCKTCQMHFESTSNLDNVSEALFFSKPTFDTGFSIKWCIRNDRLNATVATELSKPIPQ
jgi:hypothetical protein